MQVLVQSSNEKIGYKYIGVDDPIPKNAVSCEVEEDCFLSYALYSDGICDDLIGKAMITTGMTYTVHGNAGLCPYYALMTISAGNP